MQIKLGDVIRDDKGREGAIVNIGIATDKSDVWRTRNQCKRI